MGHLRTISNTLRYAMSSGNELVKAGLFKSHNAMRTYNSRSQKMYLPDIAYKQKPTISFSIGLISIMMVERSTLMTVAQVLFLIAAAAIIQLRLVSLVMKSRRVKLY